MGFYINPRDMSKEDWLTLYGSPIQSSIHLTDALFGSWKSPDGDPMLPVCLVDNGAFTAAAVGIDAAEVNEFMRSDGRRKRWFFVPINDLITVGALPRWPL